MHSVMTRALNVLLPPHCIACPAFTEQPGTLCNTCWQAVHFISEPYCTQCGTPFVHDMGEGALCGACIADPPPFDRARSAMRYDTHSRGMILRFKYGDQLQTVQSFAEWLLRLGVPYFVEGAVVIPVPLHRRRLFTRRYNQAALLATALAKHSGLVFLPQALLRKRHTPPQAELSREQRVVNVKGAFVVHPRHAVHFREKHVILIDDVMTTGATIRECARVLKKAGAKEVTVLTIARTVEGEW